MPTTTDILEVAVASLGRLGWHPPPWLGSDPRVSFFQAHCLSESRLLAFTLRFPSDLGAILGQS